MSERLNGMLDTLNLGDNAACYLARRNCSISPGKLAGFLGALACASLLIAAVFASLGAWVIFPFAGLELVAFAAVFYFYARHASDYERIQVDCGDIRVEVCDGNCVHCHQFNSQWARLVVAGGHMQRRIALRSHGREVELGRHLHATERLHLESELRRWLRLAA